MAMVVVKLLDRRTASRRNTLLLAPRKSLGTSMAAMEAREAGKVEAGKVEAGRVEAGAKKLEEAEVSGTVQGHRSKSPSSRITFCQGQGGVEEEGGGGGTYELNCAGAAVIEGCASAQRGRRRRRRTSSQMRHGRKGEKEKKERHTGHRRNIPALGLQNHNFRRKPMIGWVGAEAMSRRVGLESLARCWAESIGARRRRGVWVSEEGQ